MQNFDKYKDCEGCDSCEGARYCFRTIEEDDQYLVSVTYDTWNQDAIDAGDTDDRGFYEQDATFESIAHIYSAYRDLATWQGWSNSHWPRGWIYGSEDDMRTGDTTWYNIHITRQDGAELSRGEVDQLTYLFNLR